jgi:hypothetical protein
MRDGGGVRFGRYVLNYALEIRQYVLRGYPQGSNAPRRKPSITCLVVPHSEVVWLPVDLDAQLMLIAIEVEDVRTCRMLSSETQSHFVLPQNAPQEPFGQRH